MTLQNICLTAIVRNFETFFKAFSTTIDVNLKRKFEFLQRVYSQEIATQLLDECGAEEKYTDFVINKYVKSLDTNWFRNCPWKSVIAKMAEVGPNIKKIYFYEYSKERPWHEIFCYLPNLEMLHFDLYCVDEILSSVAEFCPDIVQIELRSSSGITEEGFKSLCKIRNGKVSCSKLKNIIFDYCCVVTEGAAKCLVKNLPSLEVFQCCSLPLVLYSMHHHDLPALDKVEPYKLTELDFSSASTQPDYGDILKLCFSLCPNLKTLTCPVLKPQHLDLIAVLSNLEILQIEYSSAGELLDINDFLKLKGCKLTSLTIRRCIVSVLTLAENCPSLNKLHLINADVKYDSSIPLFDNLDAFMVEVIEFGLRENSLKSVCLILSSSPKLESMAFKHCDLTLSEIKTVILNCCEHVFIKKIDFGWSSVDKQFIMDILLTSRSLKSFILENSELDSDDEEEIYKCAEILPNNPDVFITKKQNFSDSDDTSSDSFNYDYDYDDGEYYEPEPYNFMDDIFYYDYDYDSSE